MSVMGEARRQSTGYDYSCERDSLEVEAYHKSEHSRSAFLKNAFLLMNNMQNLTALRNLFDIPGIVTGGS